ncbi:SWI/SNF-related matrix-associated actin-dependent regulator of chromatin subfamily A-like protein 1 [Ornithodoros turicata]|uniref:SWI/SNF-related matrix-associated actin-dependent regulator of chromatin subfamily A-like protein 1 n=1 Tax=Ornithodoros turicata TaxID=34597 RepID=UPI003138974C
MSTVLTEDQKRRIEENRLKALERRKASQNARLAANQAQNNFQPSTCSTAKANNASSQAYTSQGKPTFYSQESRNQLSVTPANSNRQSTSQKSCTSYTAPNITNASTQNQSISSFASTSNKVTSGSCVMISHDRFSVDVPYHQQMIEIFRSMPSKMYDAEKKRWSFAISEYESLMEKLKPLRPSVVLGGIPPYVITALKSRTASFDVDLSGLDSKLSSSLFPFQREGVCTAVQRGGRILIADDMGLGKTIQAIAVASYYREEWPVLVITPSSVRFAWKEAFLQWVPSLAVDNITVLLTSTDAVSNHEVVITSYDLMSRKAEEMCNAQYRVVILDESHFIKNPKSARTKACQKAMKKARRVILLTGTPALSRPVELYTQISAVVPKFFPGMQEFGIRYCNGKLTSWGWDYSGSSNMHELQLLLEKTIMIRRLKSDVISQLPAKQRQVVLLDPGTIKTSDKVLKHMAKEMQNKDIQGMQRRGVLLTYFRETGLVKAKAICKYIEDLLEGDQKFLCFAHHQNVMDEICELLTNKTCSHIRIDGKTLPETRKQLCDKFQYDETCKVAVLSITAANAGITLSAASLVVFAELFWNPGILTQAEDRAHRIGQQNCVIVQYLVAKGTADDYIWPLVQKKLDILSKAGLSKDNFHEVDLRVSKEREQPTLDDFLNDDATLIDLLDDFDTESEIVVKKSKMM